MRTELSRALPLVGLFVLGLAAGVWSIISPWVVGYPFASAWSSSVWSSVWVGVVVAVASAIGLVAVPARALYLTLNPPSAGRPD